MFDESAHVTKTRGDGGVVSVFKEAAGAVQRVIQK
jgi:hypothetical protein